MYSRLTIAALALGVLCLCAAAAFAQAPNRIPHCKLDASTTPGKPAEGNGSRSEDQG